MVCRNEFMEPELSTTGFLRADRDREVMGQQLPSWRTGNGQTLWLSMLIEAMEKLSRPERRGRPDRLGTGGATRPVSGAPPGLKPAAIRARLAEPATACCNYGSRFGLPN